MVNTKEMTESLIKELAFSEEELRELKAAKEKPIVFDEDCAHYLKRAYEAGVWMANL